MLGETIICKVSLLPILVTEKTWETYPDNYGRSWYLNMGQYLLWAYVGTDRDKKEFIIMEALRQQNPKDPFPKIWRKNEELFVSPAMDKDYFSQFKEALKTEGIEPHSLPKLERLLKDAVPTTSPAQDTVSSESKPKALPSPSSGSLIPDPA